MSNIFSKKSIKKSIFTMNVFNKILGTASDDFEK